MGFSLADILGGGGAIAAGPLGYFAGSAVGGRDPKEAAGVLANGYNAMSGKTGLETAAAGAREAQAQANALSDLQWQRQMQGLQEARGQTQPYLSLYDKIYNTQTAGHQTPVGGMGLGMMGGPRAGGQAPYVQSAAPRMVGPGQFMPASRVAGDAMLRGRIAERVGGSSNSLPGGPAYAGLPNGNAATPYMPQGQSTMQTQDLLGQWLRSRV